MNAAKKSITATKTAKAAAINDAALKNLENISANSRAKDDKRFLAISLQTYVSAMSSSLMSAKNAIMLEAAIGLACYEENGGTNKEAKRALAIIYSQGGWNNLNPKDEDYTTVNRHLNAIAVFYDWLDKGEISRWTEGKTEMHAINAIMSELEQFNLKGINSLLSYAGKHPAKKAKEKAEKQAQEKPERKPEDEQQQGQPSKVDWTGTTHGGETSEAKEQGDIGNANVTQLRRRTDDVTEEGTLYIVTEHMKIAIPPETTREELIKCAQELLLKAYEIPEAPIAQAAQSEEEEPDDNIGNREQKAPVNPSEVAAKINQRQAGRKIK